MAQLHHHHHHHIDPIFAHSVPFPMHPMHVPFMTPEHEVQGRFPGAAAAIGWPTEYNAAAAAQGVGNNIELFTPAFLPVVPGTVPAEHCFPGQTPDPSFIQNGLVFPSISPPYASNITTLSSINNNSTQLR